MRFSSLFSTAGRGSRHEERSQISFPHILNEWYGLSEKPVVLMIDEVDSAADNLVFLDILSQLRAS